MANLIRVFILTLSTFLAASSDAYSLQNKNSTGRPKDPANLGPIGTQLQLAQPKLYPFSTAKIKSAEVKLKALTSTGARAITWLNLVNKDRAIENKLLLADRSTKNPVPPNAPAVISEKKMLQDFKTRTAELPDEMKAYLLENKTLTSIPPVSDEIFITHIRKLNSSYQNAIRWIGQEPWLSHYEQNNRYDIRGIYFINRDQNFKTDLENYPALTPDRQKTISVWLVGLCNNQNGNTKACLREFLKLHEASDIANYFKKYLPYAEKTYKDFFKVNSVRKELKWNSEKTKITQDFIMPSVLPIANWLKSNVEEEWKALNFQLLVNYISNNNTAPYIQFEAGVTPNVSGSTWNTITMDPNYSLDDFSTQWTIRHEFGHILGFPDCYLEFYDSKKKEMIYYTIETENLMCAWGGKLQQSHVQELQKAY